MRAAALALALVALAGPARAAQPSFSPSWELGFMLGAPTGLTVKRMLGGSDALDLGVGVGPGLRFHGDYLVGLARVARGPDAMLDLYLGGGAVIGTGRGFCGYYHHHDWCDGDFFVGGRVPFGLDVHLQKAPVALGLEVAPGLGFGPSHVDWLFDVFLYVRFVLR